MQNVNTNFEFSEFGRKMNTIAILTILTIIPNVGTIISIVQIAFIFSALKNIKNVASALKNQKLLDYRSKYISGFIFSFIGMILFIIGLLLVLFTELLIFLIILILGVVFFIVGGVLEMQAWDNFTSFIKANNTMFPPVITREVLKGSNNLKNAALCQALGFLIVTIFIAWILSIIGYFKLAGLKDVYALQYQQNQVEKTQPMQQQSVTPSDKVKYCPHCGSATEGDKIYCDSCGARL